MTLTSVTLKPKPIGKRASQRRIFLRTLPVLGLLSLSACSSVVVQPGPANVRAEAAWALLPIVNLTQTPQAGLRAESILESLLRARGVLSLRRYPAELNKASLFEPAERDAVEAAYAWAGAEGMGYALTGSVDEWRYKVGVDGEPAVGITLQLIDVKAGNVVWSATGSKTGWSREALSAVAQKLLTELSQPLATLQKPRAKAR